MISLGGNGAAAIRGASNKLHPPVALRGRPGTTLNLLDIYHLHNGVEVRSLPTFVVHRVVERPDGALGKHDLAT